MATVKNSLPHIPDTSVTTLGNQLKVATHSLPLETATVGVWIDAGSACENEKNNGAAHFLEHMSFKGTANRTKKQLEVEIENIGGSLNAYTSRESTVYCAKVLKNDVPKAVDILSDIILKSTLDTNAIEEERSTILREMQEINKDTQEVVFDYLHAAAFQGHSLSRTILGPPENVQSLKKEDLQSYIKHNYVGAKMSLIGAGGVSHNELVDLANKSFGSLPASSSSTVSKAKPVFTGSLIQERDDAVGAAHVCLAFESVGWRHPDYYVFQVLQTIVGAWDKSLGGGKNLSSRLCELMATENLVDSISTFNTTYHDTGLFGAYLVNGGGEKLEDAIFEVFNEFNRISKNISSEEVERAKRKLKASILMQLDGTSAIAEDIGRQIFSHGRRLSVSETFAVIDAITNKDVTRVVKEHFEDQCPAVAAVGKTEELPDYNQIRGWTYWMRW
jgi:processing peptidase subunit beta